METSDSLFKSVEKQFDISALITRLMLGVVVLGHGLQKAFGWFGGYGFEGTTNYFTETIGVPYLAALIIILIETIGMMSLILGFLGRYIAGAIIVVMIGAILFNHMQFGFFMNWGGNLKGEGYEFHLLIIAMALSIIFSGTGAYSLDKLLRKGRV